MHIRKDIFSAYINCKKKKKQILINKICAKLARMLF